MNTESRNGFEMYDFANQLDKGQRHENRLDDFFARYDIQIEESTMAEQRRGIDRWFVMPGQSKRHPVEYKACEWFAKTNNFALEVVSVFNGKRDKKGWVYTTQAERLVYYAVGTGRMFWLDPAKVRRAMPELLHRHRLKAVPNSSYHTFVLLVPYDDFKQYIDNEVPINDEK